MGDSEFMDIVFSGSVPFFLLFFFSFPLRLELEDDIAVDEDVEELSSVWLPMSENHRRMLEHNVS